MTKTETTYTAGALVVRLKISRTVYHRRWNRMLEALNAGREPPPLLPAPVIDPVTGRRWWTEAAVVAWESEFGHEFARNFWKEAKGGK